VGVTPITNPDAHLLCWSILVSQQPSSTVTVTNQFGSGELTTGQPKVLCLPSWKNLTGPPNQPVNQPPGRGTSLRRPGLHSALELIASGGADGLIASKLDRVSRSVIDFATLLAWFAEDQRI
jgi:hypothetical protein